ncbi:MAG: chemotaxis protein, partial [Pseudomonadota bacterium]|nr:chemotaxis protein [Pseudomonadota bacterium]
MPAKLSFNHKILLAACLVVIAAFAAFSAYNDYLQRRTLQANLDTYLSDAGTLTADNISNWLSGRILLLENLAQNLQSEPPERLVPLLEQRTLAQTFEFSYLGGGDGSFTMRPDDEMPAGYDPRTRPWFKSAREG